jgi:DNA-binding transcriptional MocR family regulator
LTFDAERAPDVIDMSLAFPPYSADPDLSEALRNLSRRDEIQGLLRYQPSRGLRRHRSIAAQWAGGLSLDITEEDVLICAGAQHALTILFGALFQPGDRILTEALTYPGVKGLASMFNLRLQPLATDNEGIIPESFEAESARERVKALYLVPTVHNPTTSITPESRRKRIAQLAMERNILIIEDECYGLILRERPQPIYYYAPENTFLIIGVSKAIAAGLRVAHLISPKRFVGDLALAITHTVWTTSPITSELAAQWIESGHADEIIENRRVEAIARNRLVDRVLGGLRYRNRPESFFTWLELPAAWTGEQLESAARERGVYVSVAEKFMVGNAHAPNCVRICVTGPNSRDHVKKGLEVIRDLLSGSPPKWPAAIL